MEDRLQRHRIHLFGQPLMPARMMPTARFAGYWLKNYNDDNY